MEKVRINDLARELEVKSKAVLDYLPSIGVTEKKSHSSSLEHDEADKVRKHFAKAAEASAAEKRKAPAAAEVKPKIDLSKISKPGDVLKAISKQTAPEAPAAPIGKPAAAPISKPAAPTAAPPAAAKPTAPIVPPRPAEKPAAPAAPAQTHVASIEAAAEKPAVVAKPPAAPPTAAPPQAAASGISSVPPRRLITPQTGPRPVYAAPQRPAAATVTPGQPIGQGMRPRPVPGRPVPGQPICQRPRPAGPTGAARQPLRPGERRPMHPTRTSPTGIRPPGMRAPGAAPGLPPPGERRPGGPARRPGQRYQPRGVKEGPMKGFRPPPSMASLSSEPLPITRTITITEGVSVKDLAEKLGVRAKEVIARLLSRGVFATINQTLDAALASEMSRQFGADTNIISFEQQTEQQVEEGLTAETDAGRRHARWPVVTIMGHVDHGKTSLLDAIRETNVAGGEAGGITQHIGAYKVKILDPNSPAFGREIVFLDTPGHEAFTRMRARGAKVTDIVVLVVAADDGVMPQTKEAIDHARAAKVPIIVAINKIDKPEAQLERVKRQLTENSLMPAEWGGDTEFVEVSAKKKQGIDKLLETILLVADLRELKANPDAPATGTVLESRVDKGRGPVATILVQNGTLKAGDFFICGSVFGKVRAMFDDRGRVVNDAPPSTPVEVLGLQGVPDAGDLFQVTDEAKARHIVEYRQNKQRDAAMARISGSRITLDQLHEQLKAGDVKELGIVIKGDVHGSVEVLSEMLPKLSTDQVQLKIIGSGVGAVTENDVLLASASGAIVIAFGVRPDRKALDLAQQEHVDIRTHTIIYEVSDEIKKAMEGLLEPVVTATYLGRAEVRNTFRVKGAGTIAGCYVVDGILKRDAQVRVVRDGAVIYTSKLSSLKRFKDDASEVRTGFE